MRLRSVAARMPWVAVVVPFGAAYIALALAQPVPIFQPDESFYQHLARSLAGGDGLTWRGGDVSLRSALYVYLITPCWWLASGVGAYQLAKVETVAFACLVSVPIWLLARELLGRPLALLTVALALAGTWMATAQSLLTESVALPLATACLASTAQALRRPGASRLVWLALAFALLGAWARMQLVVLVPIVVLALTADVVRAGAGWRARLRSHGLPLAVIGGVLALGALAVLLAPATFTGGYSGIFRFRPSVTGVLRGTGLELLQLAAMCGFLPLALLAVLATRRAAWRDPAIGPLLAVLVPAVAVLAVQNGCYLSGSQVPWPIQRYMSYAAPLLLLFCVVALTRPALVTRTTLVATALLSLLLALTPEVGARLEEGAVFATTERLRDVLPGIPEGASVTIVAVLLCVVGLAWLTIRPRADRAALAAVVGGNLLVVLAGQTATQSRWQIDYSRAVRSGLPADLAWIDHHSTGPVAVLQVTGRRDNYYVLDDLNAHITQYFVPYAPLPTALGEGRSCRWTILRDGGTRFSRACGPPASTLFLNDPVAHLTFFHETASVAHPRLGRLVTVRGHPRLEALVKTPCPRPQTYLRPVTFRPYPPETPIPCEPQLLISTWLSRPGTVVVRLQGGPLLSHTAQVGSRRYTVPAAGVATVRIPMGPSEQHVAVDLDWSQASPDDPRVLGVELEQDGVRRSLL
ncbi:hypothetical protein [Baekduia sp.]|uniref:hypothetical protein n=1 Tax=Baekduia sp. TaxID=2600305 RepID=UPI002D1FAFEC|nr:hypothetical protein [Baekduia sp.]